ncbi:MAG: BMC domain-containing protein, partial [Clostridia bacterium]|nr:BMC domain-containing protein [Clostridia bacterium]
MMKSLGFVEVSGVVAAVDALDIMCKSADVSLVSWERKLGGRLVTLIVTGTVSAVQAAVDNACAGCIKKPVASAVIANPHPETVRLAELSASRLKKAEEAKKTAESEKPTPAKSVRSSKPKAP